MLGTLRGALWVPDWPVAAAIASSLAAPEEAVAVCDSRVRAASPAARRKGVRRGDTRRRALSLVPDLTIIPRDDDRDSRVFAGVLDAIDDHVASTVILRPGLVTFGASAPARLAGGLDALAASLISSVASQAEESQVGYGCGLLTSVLAARESRHVPAEETASFLAPFPISAALTVAGTERVRREWDETIDVLSSLGITTIGQFSALEHSQIASRFGLAGTILWRLCHGADHAVIQTTAPAAEIAVRRHVEAIAHEEQAAFLAKELADELAEKLATRMLVCGQLAVQAQFADGGERSRTWSVDGVNSARDITDRVRWQISGWLDSRHAHPLGELIHLELTAADLAPAGTRQTTLWGDRQRGREQAQRSVLRIQGMLGDSAVQSVRLTGGRCPDAAAQFENWHAVQERAESDRPWVGAVPKPWPSVVFPNPPRVMLACHCGGGLYVDASIQLACVGCAEPRPAILVLAPMPGRSDSDRPDSSQAHAACYYSRPVRVWNYAGPWSISGRWWASDAYRRAYLQVGVEGPAALIYRSGTNWFLEGIYS
ncbi:DNA polymerase Y family protein [Flaviflexus salsibiostraticola]|uniref:DNA polymerase Y family protein n=1 Tax=Flaviflexus salsibiostraticola TaxID=1282737 RepID=A0A3Q8WSB8_9ACTO|nr:DNA polymerase Y family protein [Flaviflexus salsibiostraticola]AZN29129.1 DNA polymerase Y family protein [Flaviflexus salsibiostraticola]